MPRPASPLPATGAGTAGPAVSGPAEGLYIGGDSAVHRLPAHAKLVTLVLVVLLVVATPGRAWWALLGDAGALVAVATLARIPAAVVLRRLLVETPFVVFAVLLPFVATGPRVDVLGVSLSSAGLLGAWTLLAKGTAGVLAAIVLAATTRPADLLAGLDRLRLPRTLVAIVAFMLRYAGVVSSDLQRMRVARMSRGYTGGRLGHLRIEAAGVGALFVRTYERGERVSQAMLARGYTGTMPAYAGSPATPVQWLTCAVLPALAAVLLVLARRP